MRQALELTTAGRSQAEIGAILNCAPRTVRDLLREGRVRRVLTFKSRSAEEVLADVEHRAAANYARWISAWVRARAAGDLRAEAYVLARMDQANFGRVSMLARVGFFDHVTLATGREADQQDRKAKRDRQELEGIVSLLASLNRGESMETFAFPDRVEDDAETFDPADSLY